MKPCAKFFVQSKASAIPFAESVRESCMDHHLSGSPVASGRRATNALRTKRRSSHPTFILMRTNCVTQVRFNNQIAIIRKYESECG